MSRLAASLIACAVTLAACGGGDSSATDDTTPERFCERLQQANNNNAFVNLHSQYFQDWPELTGLVDNLEETAPPDMAPTVATFAGLVDRVAAADRSGVERDPTEVLDDAAAAELAAVEAVLDAYAVETCSFALFH